MRSQLGSPVGASALQPLYCTGSLTAALSCLSAGLTFDVWPWDVRDDVSSDVPPHLVLGPVKSIDRESLRGAAALHSWCIDKGVALVAPCTLSTPSLQWKVRG